MTEEAVVHSSRMDNRFLFAFFDRPAQEQEDDYEIKKTDRCSADGGRDGMLHFAGKCTGGGKLKSKCGGLMRTPHRTQRRMRLYRGHRGDTLRLYLRDMRCKGRAGNGHPL